MNQKTKHSPVPHLRSPRSLVIGLLALLPAVASSQVGRHFVSAEAFVGRARVIHVGKIVELEPAAYGKPLTDTQKLGRPHRLVLEVGETIRGEAVGRLELVLSLQSTHLLGYMRDHAIETLLVVASDRLTRFPGARVGIEEQGKRVDGDWYHFRVLEPVEVPEVGAGKEFASQINTIYDHARMFTHELGVIAGREAILGRMRAFAKRHPDGLPSVILQVPNAFGSLVGDPNAYCGISLPICPETKATLLALKEDPGLILRRIESRNEDADLSRLKEETEKALAEFPKYPETSNATRSSKPSNAFGAGSTLPDRSPPVAGRLDLTTPGNATP